MRVSCADLVLVRPKSGLSLLRMSKGIGTLQDLGVAPRGVLARGSWLQIASLRQRARCMNEIPTRCEQCPSNFGEERPSGKGRSKVSNEIDQRFAYDAVGFNAAWA